MYAFVIVLNGIYVWHFLLGLGLVAKPRRLAQFDVNHFVCWLAHQQAS
jgi:hypothetical protein